jgi:hypothetical protein
VEGLGAPAISSQVEGDETPTLEVAAKGVTLGVTSVTLGLSKALAAKAVARACAEGGLRAGRPPLREIDSSTTI